eukprot:2608295-Pleurochrysis_carterae.AAC.1
MPRSKCSPRWPWGACRLQVTPSPWPEPTTTTNARASLCPFPLSPTFKSTAASHAPRVRRCAAPHRARRCAAATGRRAAAARQAPSCSSQLSPSPS